MSEFIFWLECRTMEEMFLLTYGCIFGLGLLMVPVAWFLDKRRDDHEEDK